MIDISNVKITEVKNSRGLVAFASVVVNSSLYLGSIAIHRKLDGRGYRITYPSKRSGDKDFQVFHPINAQTAKAIEQAIFNELKDVTKDDRYDCNNTHKT